MKHPFKSTILIGISTILTSCNGGGSSSAKPLSISSINVPLTYTVDGESMDLHMPIKVGNNSLEVAVDTGSVGLRALKSQITDMTNITVSDTTTDYAYEDGVYITGNTATAPIIFTGTDNNGNNTSISETISFMLITRVDCISSKPDCPKADFISSGRGGVMGVRPNLNTSGSTTAATDIWSPLSQLSGNLSNGFIISGNTTNPNITIGLTSTNRQGFSLLNLTAIPQPTPKAPYNLWDVTLKGSYAFNKDSPTTSSVIFDTGTNNIEIKDSNASNQPIGTPLNISVTGASTGSLSWNTNTASSGFYKTNVLPSEGSTASVNTGGAPFQVYNVLYDIENGNIGFQTNTTN